MTTRAFTIAVLVLVVIVGAALFVFLNPGANSRAIPNIENLQAEVIFQPVGPTPDLAALNRALETIQIRLRDAGYGGVPVYTNALGNIILGLTIGLSAANQEHILDLVGQQASLEFRLVQPARSDPLQLSDLEDVSFTGEIISDARAAYDSMTGTQNGPMVTFNIRRADRQSFGNFTGDNVGRRMAIVMDSQIITAPQLNGRISDTGQITGLSNMQEAADLALVFRSGALPFALEIKETVQRQ